LSATCRISPGAQKRIDEGESQEIRKVDEEKIDFANEPTPEETVKKLIKKEYDLGDDT